MIKVCSLDFLNSEFFEKDIILSDGKILFSAGDKVSAEALLKLYFRNIYVQNPITDNKSLEQDSTNVYNKPPVVSHSNAEPVHYAQSKYVTSDFENVAVIEKPVEKINISGHVVEELSTEDKIDFCNKILEYSAKIGKVLGFSNDEMIELKQLAHYYAMETTGNDIPDEMKEFTKFCYKEYRTNEFSLDKQIPYAHIIFIINYYLKTLKLTQSKQKTILKMLQLGNNKFNPFVLHKFFNMMK